MKMLLLFVKISPIVLNIMILIGLIFAVIGVPITNWMYPIFGHSLFLDILLLYMSKQLKFCVWHRILLLNLVFIILLEWIDINIVDINVTIYIYSLLFITTFILMISTLLYYKHGCFKTTTGKNHLDNRCR